MNIERLIIIREDGFVSINGRGLVIDLSDMPTDLHAVQWSGSEGHIERAGQPNEKITGIGDFITWIERWQALADELDAPPPPPTPEQILAAKKAERQAIVDAIVVTVSTGKVFDGNEEAQSRMSRAIQTAEIAGIESTTWVLANNVPTVVTLLELKEALVLSMQAMGDVWATPYED